MEKPKMTEIQCDNPACDYSEPCLNDTATMELFIDKPCPKCKSILLTRPDFIRWNVLERLDGFMHDEKFDAQSCEKFFSELTEEELPHLMEFMQSMDQALDGLSEEEVKSLQQGGELSFNVHGHDGYTISSPKVINKGGDDVSSSDNND
jgi:hypothetical protein